MATTTNNNHAAFENRASHVTRKGYATFFCCFEPLLSRQSRTENVRFAKKSIIPHADEIKKYSLLTS